MFSFLKKHSPQNELINSKLFDEKTFYQSFIKDLENCKREVFVESPYITRYRVNMLLPIFRRLLYKGVAIYVMTRDIDDHDVAMGMQIEEVIDTFEHIGIQVLLCKGNHHRKLAILDRQILWEGSLNILSQSYSREIMRRIDGKETTMQMFDFLKLNNFI